MASDKTNGMVVRAVFRASVKADRGPGSTTAVVVGQSGKARLYGLTSLVRAGLVSDAYEGKSLTAEKLAALLKVPVIVGGEKCKAFITSEKLALDIGNEVIGDVNAGGKGKGGFGRQRPFGF